MQEDDHRFCIGHVMVDGHHIETVASQCLERWGDFGLEHGDVPGNRSIFVGAKESRPGVQAHPGIDRRSHLLYREIIAANGDLVHCAVLFTLVSNDLRDLGRIESAFGSSPSLGWSRCTASDQIERRLDLVR